MFYSIRTQLIAIIVMLIVPFVLMGYLFWNQAATALRESIETTTVQTMNQYADFVESATSQIVNTANQILRSDMTQDWIRSRMDNEDAAKEIQQNIRMRKYFDSVVSNSPIILSVNLFHERWDLWNLEGGDYLETDWYANYRNHGIRWTDSHIDARQNGIYLNRKNVNSLVYPLSDLMNLSEEGMLKINIQTSALQEPLDKLVLGKTGKAFLIAPDGVPILNQKPDAFPDALMEKIRSLADDETKGTRIFRDDERRSIYFYQRMETTGWVVVGTVSEKELFQEITRARQNVIWVAALLFIVAVSLTFWFSSRIANPISRIVRSMKFVEEGDFFKGNAIMARKKIKQNEIGFLTANYLDMVKRLKTYIETEFAQNLRRRNAEYKALLLQINPHFLNNTLEVITSLAAQGRNEDIEQVVNDLSLMLRSSLRMDTELISVRDEIGTIRAFTSILSVCYGNRVQFEIVDGHVSDSIQIPKLLLQPLIENAVKYSLGIVEVAIVSIRIEETDEELTVVIKDNGLGIPEEVLKELKTAAELNFPQDVLNIGEKGIGFKNVIARGRIYYGSRFTVEIRTAANQGTEITMIIPNKR
ncbi:sensor histidine kinase [Cohnella herbarum]|uniref:Histidine kinase n=1 Tax=Cohnella herbarum TaxID=2728023 RepID=A0A7Z2VPV6_9BACL|nr:sensor histidine kinase [Cohnella herbarum]QJD86924.1 histidine kinase [Cohnella herbarum]